MKFNGLKLFDYNEDELHKQFGKTLDTTYHVKPKHGQLKLLLNEIYFIHEMLNKYNKIEYIFVCGGAPGIHYDLLSDMYSDIRFVLYDKVKFYGKLYSKKNIIIKPTYFNSYIAKTIGDTFHNSLFISDMRTLEIEESKENETKINSIYLSDMYQQMAFFRLTKCKSFMLKFKVPLNMTIPYLDGIILIQPFIFSNEMRLVGFDDSAIKYYNGNEIERQAQLVNNYWKTFELEMTTEEANFIKKYNLKNNWDNISLFNILKYSNKLDYVDRVVKFIKKSA